MSLPTVNVEIDGKVVARPRTLRVLLCDERGTVTCTQPQLWPGEHLVERPGQIPMIVKEPVVSDQKVVYRHQMVRAVLGTHPAMLAKEADSYAIDCLCNQLVDAENAKALLRANGHGRFTDSLEAMVRTMLDGRELAAA